MALESVQRWLLDEGRFILSPEQFIRQLCVELNRAGLEITRCNVPIRTMHPEVAVRIYIWRSAPIEGPEFPDGQGVVASRVDSSREGVMQVYSIQHEPQHTPEFVASPIYRVMTRRERVHVPIGPDEASDAYPVIADFRAEGATGYVCLPVIHSDRLTSPFSLVTERAGGFDEAALQGLDALMPVLSMSIERFSAANALEGLLQTYVGHEPARHVLAGRFQLGDVQHVRAAIWFSDLRGFTGLASTLSSRALVQTLNQYFGVLARPLERYKGALLKFIGDAVLVLFPVDDARDERQACVDALAAARAACAELAAMNAANADADAPQLAHGIGLHFGHAEYGNVGMPTRLDFTVIGHDVNVTARIESMCRPLGRELLASRSFADRVPDEPFSSTGEHRLAGVPELVEIVAFPLAEPGRDLSES